MRSVLLLWKTFAYTRDRRVGDRLVQEEDESLARTPLFREVLSVNLQCVKHDSVALCQPFTIVCQDAIRDFATGFDKRFSSESDRKIRSIVVRRPQQNCLGRNLSCFRQNLGFSETQFLVLLLKIFFKKD